MTEAVGIDRQSVIKPVSRQAPTVSASALAQHLDWPVDPACKCADEQRAGLRRIAATLDAVPYVTWCNLANLNAALRGGLMDLIEVRLMCVGAGPTLDYADAVEFLATFERLIEQARWLRLQ